MKTKYYEMLPIFKQMQTENQQMKMELKQNESIIQYMQNCIQQFKTTLEAQVQLSLLDYYRCVRTIISLNNNKLVGQ